MSVTMIMDLINNILLLFSLVVIRNFFEPRTKRVARLTRGFQGILIGGICVLLMYKSFLLRPGLFFDTRTVLLSITGLFFGIIPALFAAAVALIYRIWTGGSGIAAGAASILVSTIMGILWGRVVQKKQLRLGWRHNFLFGLTVHLGILLVFLIFLPRPDNIRLTGNLLVPYLILFPLASALLGRLLAYQSDYMKTQEKLKESRELYRNLFRDNHTVMLLIDPDKGDIRDANQAAVDYYGWPYLVLTSMSICRINTNNENTVLENLALAKNQKMLHLNSQHRRADGSIREVESYSSAILQEGQILIISLIHDITRRRETERQLKKSEFQLSRAEIIAGLGHWELDLNTKYFSASEGAVNIYGAEDSGLEMSLVQKIPLPEDRPVLDTALKNLITAGTPYDLQFRIKRPNDGEIRIIHSVAEFDKEENTVFGVIHDITSYKKAEEKIRQEKERLAVTLHSIGDGVITTDAKGRIQLMNPVAEEMTGWPLKDAYTKPLPEVFHIVNEYTRIPCPNPVELVFETNGVIELANHTLLIARDGREKIIADSGAPIRDEAGNIIGTVLVFRDTTEKQMLQSRIQQADKLESLGILAGGIAHDFNNLLGGIFGYLEIAREISSDEQINEYLDLAMQVYNRTADLTRQLLTFSKGNLPDRKTGNLTSLIQDSVSFSLSGSSVSSTLEIDRDLWPCSYDENQIGQVLDNLLINAKQAMPGGGKITIAAENVTIDSNPQPNLAAGKYIRISVSDTGPGIPTDILPRIFEPFFSTKELGSGLGLATCYSILEKHDGGIEVVSIQGETIFRVYLPVSDAQVNLGEVPMEPLLQSGGRILVMDDEPFLRQILEEMLQSMGFRVTTAKEGREALEAIENAEKRGEPFTAAILDLTVPGGMGGKETVESLRKSEINLPVFACSGYSDDPIIASPETYGFTASIKKPYRRKDLSALLSRYLID